jgi:exopolysaccharide biosynthesis protein
LPPGDLLLREGMARNVAFSGGARPRLTVDLSGVAGSLGSHELHALAGPLVVTADGLGTPGISGTVDRAIPVDVSGEVHDAGGWARAFGAGTNDLRALAKLFGAVASQPNLKWMKVETTAPGIAFGQYAMTTKDIPHVVNLLTVDPREPTVRFGTALAEDHVISRGERTSDLGVRTNAVAGVNGDYFDIGRTYEPQGMLVRDGKLLHGPTDHYALTFDRSNTVRFAIFRMRGQVVAGERSFPITQFNSWPGRNVSVITPDYGKVLPAAPGMSFAALETIDATHFRVRSVQSASTAIPVQLGLGFGSAVKGRLPRPGDVVEVTYALDPPIDGVVAGISSGPLLLKNGEWYEDKRAPAPDERDVPWPVVALGTMPDGTLMFAAVDGRHPERSIGMARPEFAELLKGFGVIDAMALDSGGSVTMVSRAPGNSAVTVRNVPSDNSAERYVSDALFVYSTAPQGTIVTGPRTTASTKPPL